MRKIISTQVAANVLLVLLALAFVFQLVVLGGFIPREMVWGGRLESAEQGTAMALVALAILALMILTVLNRSGRLGPTTSIAGLVGIWLMFLLFALNTLGNLAALDLRETLIFTPITLIAALLCLRLALKAVEKAWNFEPG